MKSNIKLYKEASCRLLDDECTDAEYKNNFMSCALDNFYEFLEDKVGHYIYLKEVKHEKRKQSKNK